ncbi:hypothetical protein NC652_030377 [Populus alba x Populus x berolinensis]|nr:hypothetical protein NC652_030377 [Populus alba x Populus x berolinensis]
MCSAPRMHPGMSTRRCGGPAASTG